MKNEKSARHHLFHGELRDAPGRNETWDDYLCYLGKGRWRLISEGTDFSGLSHRETITELMSTRDVIAWVLVRDSEIDESGVQDDFVDGPRSLGLFASRLRVIAELEGADYCLQRLDSWLSGRWDPTRPAINIVDIIGITKRSVWRGVYHYVYDAETNQGPAYLFPPDDNRTAKLMLKSESTTSEGIRVIVPEQLLVKVRELEPLMVAKRAGEKCV